MVPTSLHVIAIDGPAGSGKSTVAKLVAERTSLEYLDTGAMYRAATLAVQLAEVDFEDANGVFEVVEAMDLHLAPSGTVLLDDLNVTEEIRGHQVTSAVSEVAAQPRVRAELVAWQRSWAAERGGGVLEGRDIGSVVFPDAFLKVYLSARPEIRAARRAGEVVDVSVAAVAADLARRDAADSGRKHAPLRVADGAVDLDTSDLTINEVVDTIVELAATEMAGDSKIAIESEPATIQNESPS